ncbi:MAG: helix-turn-helix transcriptional regulator, partial [Bacteroidetes bacterium]|nr:helix-turn-helix transcriptional regulator [Bacteroidota bacterium]
MVGDKIREAREKKGYSQEQLAELLGLSQSTVNKMENGKIRPNPRRVVEIAEALEADPQELLQDEEGHFVTIINNTENKASAQFLYSDRDDLTKELIKSKDAEIA